MKKSESWLKNKLDNIQHHRECGKSWSYGEYLAQLNDTRSPNKREADANYWFGVAWNRKHADLFIYGD